MGLTPPSPKVRVCRDFSKPPPPYIINEWALFTFPGFSFTSTYCNFVNKNITFCDSHYLHCMREIAWDMHNTRQHSTNTRKQAGRNGTQTSSGTSKPLSSGSPALLLVAGDLSEVPLISGQTQTCKRPAESVPVTPDENAHDIFQTTFKCQDLHINLKHLTTLSYLYFSLWICPLTNFIFWKQTVFIDLSKIFFTHILLQNFCWNYYYDFRKLKLG